MAPVNDLGGHMLDHLEKVLETEDVDALWALHCQRMAEFGFDRLLYALTRFHNQKTLSNLDDTLILSNHNSAYLEDFLESGMFIEGPMVKWAARNVGWCSWRWIAEQAEAGLLSPAELRVVELNLRYGVRAGISISFPDVNVRTKGGIGLCAREDMRQHEVDEIWSRHGREIMVINNVTHLRISALPYKTKRGSLTPRQREVLEWVADGKTTADIATIMGLTVATVEKHLRLCRDALDVDTTAQAVLKASVQKQIFLTGTPPQRSKNS